MKKSRLKYSLIKHIPRKKTADEVRSIVAPCGDFLLNVVIVRKFTKIIKYFFQDPITKCNLYHKYSNIANSTSIQISNECWPPWM